MAAGPQAKVGSWSFLRAGPHAGRGRLDPQAADPHAGCGRLGHQMAALGSQSTGEGGIKLLLDAAVSLHEGKKRLLER